MRWQVNSSPCHCVESFEKWFRLKPYDRVGASPGAARPVGGLLRRWVCTAQTGVRGGATHRKAAGCWEMCWNKSDLLLLTRWCHTKHQSSRRVHASANWSCFFGCAPWGILVSGRSQSFCLIRAIFPFKIKIRTEMCPRDIWMCKFIKKKTDLFDFVFGG